jgi:hypothetical protein
MKNIRPLFSDRVQFPLGGRDEIRHRVREVIDNIVVIRLNLHQTAAHTCGIGSVFGRMRKAYDRSNGMLFGVQVVELKPVVKRPSGIGDLVALDYRLLSGSLRAADKER